MSNCEISLFDPIHIVSEIMQVSANEKRHCQSYRVTFRNSVTALLCKSLIINLSMFSSINQSTNQQITTYKDDQWFTIYV